MADNDREQDTGYQEKLSYTTVLIKCNEKQQFTKHQRNIKYRMEKQYGKVSTHKLQQIQLHLKQELRVESQKLKNRTVIRDRRNINRMFKTSPKIVYLFHERRRSYSTK